MTDLSKIDWSKCELPMRLGRRLVAWYRDGTLNVGMDIGKAPYLAKVVRDDGEWFCFATSTEKRSALETAIEATKIVDAFVEEQTRLRILSVQPPNGLKWYLPEETVGGKSMCLGHSKKECVIVASVPDSVLKRDAMLACVEAFDGDKRWNVRRHNESQEYVAIPDWLEPGNYAVSFRRIGP